MEALLPIPSLNAYMEKIEKHILQQGSSISDWYSSMPTSTLESRKHLPFTTTSSTITYLHLKRNHF